MTETRSTLSASNSVASKDRQTGTATPSHISVKLVKAFVQPDGSHGNGAGVVLLSGILPKATQHGNGKPNTASRESENLSHLFPSDAECLKIAKRVGLPETSFVLFPKKEGAKGKSDGGVGNPYPTNEQISSDEDDFIPKDFAAGGDTNGDGSKATADFQVKWYTPECEVDLCGHATVALAGYIHSTVVARAKAEKSSSDSNGGSRPRNRYFWRMLCKSGLLGIEVVDGVHNSSAVDSGSNGNALGNRKAMEDFLVPLPRVVMEQSIPEFCEVIDCHEISDSLGIGAENDLAITVTGGEDSEKRDKRNRGRIDLVFPFPHCEIVSTGGRDLMVPVRSTVLKEMDILGNGGNDKHQQQLCDNINMVSKRYDIVGYHMFEVDDSLFRGKSNSESAHGSTVKTNPSLQNVRKDEVTEVSTDDHPIHLNELIRTFQKAEAKGRSGVQECLEAVMMEDQRQTNEKKPQNDGNGGGTSANTAKQSRVILVTGVRNFAPFVGIPEEAATGSANGALACYLVKHLFLEACSSSGSGCSKHRFSGLSLDIPINFRFRMEQGRAMGEPCLIDAEIKVVNGAIRTVEVGGLVNVTGDSLDLDMTSA